MTETAAAYQRDDSPPPTLAPRALESNKGTYGRALLVGGSQGMTGAITLAGVSALRGGAGLVHLAVPEPCQATVAAHEPSYLTHALMVDAAGRLDGGEENQRAILDLARTATAIGCGPGLGRSEGLTRLVVALYGELAQPTVFDADALNALAEHTDQLGHHAGPRILTPHPGEFARLVSADVATVQARREELAVEFARRYRVVVALKGHRTVVSDGQRVWINTTGNPGMATGGAGDVLTGLTVALLCQGLDPYDAARLAVYLHGLAGDLAAAEVGQVSLIASDLVRYLPAAFRRQSN